MLYDKTFFDTIRQPADSSARVLVPLVMDALAPRSVLDVGCGDGTWLDAYRRAGVDEYFGIDGGDVRDVLRVPADRFAARDLALPFDLGRRFDLVQSLEVAEHLPPDAAGEFVRSLARHGDVVLFSAAIPGQGGTGHLNEQWPDHWAGLFDGAGFAAHDWVRPRLWADERVAWWYAQNALLFVRRGAAPDRTGRLPPPAQVGPGLRRVHPRGGRCPAPPEAGPGASGETAILPPPLPMPSRPGAPAISVVMPVFNGAPFLDRSVGSLRAQTFPDWELLAVDDGSADGSHAVLTRLAAADPRVRVLRHATNRGLSAARNTALAEARGPIVAYLDCDDEFYPDHFARVWEHRDRGDVLVFRYDLVDERPGALGRMTTYDPEANLGALVLDTLAVPLGVTHRRELIARLGGFDETLGRYRGLNEDADLWRRLARGGALFAFVPHQSGLYHVRSDSLARTQPAPPTGVPGPTVEPCRVRIVPSSSAAPGPPHTVEIRPGRAAPVPVQSRPRVMFASYHCYYDPSSGAAVCTRELFAALAARGWRCGAFTGPYLDDPAAAPIAVTLRDRPGVSRAPGTAGASRFTVYTVGEGGFPVTVFAPDPPAPAAAPAPEEVAGFLAVLGEAIRRFRPNVVLCYGGDPASAGVAREARRAGARVVFWLHNLAYTDAGPFRACDAVVVPSAFARDHYRAALGIEAVVLPGPFDPARVVCDPAAERCVTYVNPEPAKGVFWFARLAEVLGRTRPDVPLLVVEGRGRTGWLGRCGVDLSAVASLRRMGNTPDPRRFYRLSKLVLIPSLVRESLSRVAVEAQMNGIPVIGSGRGGLAEVLRPCGFELPIPEAYAPDTRVAPGAEVAPWAELICKLWDDPAAYAAASGAARAASRAWLPEVLIPRWEEFLERVGTRA